MKVVVDEREDDNFIDVMIYNTELEVEIARLEVGDIHIGGRWVLERKATNDFWDSWHSKRLDDELYRLIEQGHKKGWWVALLVEQTPDVDMEIMSRISKHCQTLNFLLPVVHSSGMKDSAYKIERMADKCKNRMFDYVRRPATVLPSTPDPRLAVLMGFPGIDEIRAGMWLKHFGTLQGCLENINRITEVKGIGEKTRHEIVKTMVKEA